MAPWTQRGSAEEARLVAPLRRAALRTSLPCTTLRNTTLLCMTLLCSTLGAMLVAPTRCAAQRHAIESMHLEYLDRVVRTAGTGALEGLAEAHLESGVYDLAVRDDDVHVTLRRRYREQVAACRAGVEETTATVDLGTLRYRGASERGPASAPEPLGLWLWIPPTIAAGQTVHLLEGDYAIERDLELDVANVVVPVILAEAHGERTREGAHGRFRATWSDALWFDAASGYLVRRERTELADGDDASFEETETLAVVQAAYLPDAARTPRTDPAGCPAPIDRSGAWWRVVGPVAVALGLGAAVWALRKRLSQGRT